MTQLDGQGFWVDEGATLGRTAEFPLWLLVDIHPPLYFILLAPWVKITGITEAALRYPSVIFGMLTIPVVLLTGRTLFGARAGLLAGFFQAISPFAITYSQEARMYSLVTLEVACVLLFAGRWFVRGDQRRRIAVGYVLGAVTAIGTHAFAAFCLIGLNLTVAIAAGAQYWRSAPRPPLRVALKNPRLLQWAGLHLGTLVLASPVVAFIVYQVAHYPGQDAPVPPVGWVLGNSWMAANLGTSLREQQAAVPLAALGCVVLLGLAALVRDPYQRLAAGFVAGTTVAAMAVYVLVLTVQPHYHPRYILPLTPGYYLLLGAAVAVLAARWRVAGAAAAGSIAALMLSGLALYFFNAPFAKDDARGVALALQERARSDEAIIADPVEPLQHYYRGVSSLHQIDARAVPKEMTEVLLGTSGAWFVQWWQSTLDSAGQIPYLLAKYGKQDLAASWRGYQVSHYTLPRTLQPPLDTGETSIPLGIAFEDSLRLVSGGYEAALTDRAADGSLTSGGILVVALRWRLEQPVDQDVKALVQLVDRGGSIIAEGDNPLIVGISGTKTWKQGQEAATYYVIPLPPGLPPGAYEVQAAPYWLTNRQRLRPSSPSPFVKSGLVALGPINVSRATAPRLPANDELTDRLDLEIGPEVSLFGHRTKGQDAFPGNQVKTVLYWRADLSPRTDYTMRLLLQDAAGNVVSVGPSQPLLAEYPTQQWTQGEIVRSQAQLTLGSNVRPGWYLIFVEAGPVGGPLVKYQLGGPVQVGTLPPPTTDSRPSVPLAASLGPAIELLGYDLTPEVARPGGALRLTLYWRAKAEINQTFTVFTQLLNDAPRVVAQHDAPPANGQRPTGGWRVGEVVKDEHRIELPTGVDPGSYTVQIGMYDATTMARLPLSASDKRVQDNALMLTEVAVRS